MAGRPAILALTASIALGAQAPPPTAREPQARPDEAATQAQRRPVFRGGTHFVRVDAYPVRDGRIIEGLEPKDFEILEDGKPQTIESFDFVRFDDLTPDAWRRDPQSQREGFDLAADPRYRLFVVYVDMALSRSSGPVKSIDNLPHIQQPLVNFFERVAGPSDLFALLTSRNSVKDLVLAQKTGATVEQVMDLWRANLIDRDEADEMFGFCPGSEQAIEALKLRFRADASYTNLRDLAVQLGSLRQERKNVVLVTNLLPRWRPDQKLLDEIVNQRSGAIPAAGITRGRITNDNREVVTNTRSGNASGCAGETQRLALMDFEPRFRELVDQAKRENVSFYVITPAGLQAPTTVAGIDALKRAMDDLIALANETDGIAVTTTNDLNAGFRRIADDLAAYYVLGYYSTNTKFDGRIRTLKVRYKANGAAMRARRQYRASTEAEIAALTSSAASAQASTGPSSIETALAILERGSRPFAIYAARSGSQLTIVAELSGVSIQNGRWKAGADLDVEISDASGARVASVPGRIEPGTYGASVPVVLPAGAAPARVTVRMRGDGERPAEDWLKLPPASGALLGDALAYRTASRIARRPVAAFEFARNERLRAEWPVLSPLDRREVRLLDRAGKPLPVEIPLSEEASRLIVEMSLSGIGRGDYVIEVTAGAAAAVDRRLLAIRLK